MNIFPLRAYQRQGGRELLVLGYVGFEIESRATVHAVCICLPEGYAWIAEWDDLVFHAWPEAATEPYEPYEL